MDLRAAVPEDRPLLILPGKRALVPTGLVLEIPEGFEGQVRPRSGLAFKHGITCLNTPGTIDSDYRGEVKVLLVNLGDEDFRGHARHAHRPDRLCAGRAGDRTEERSLAGSDRARLRRLRLDRHQLMRTAKARHLRLRRDSRRHREAGQPPPGRMADRGRLSRQARILPQVFLRPQHGLRAAGDRSRTASASAPISSSAGIAGLPDLFAAGRRGDPSCRELHRRGAGGRHRLLRRLVGAGRRRCTSRLARPGCCRCSSTPCSAPPWSGAASRFPTCSCMPRRRWASRPPTASSSRTASPGTEAGIAAGMRVFSYHGDPYSDREGLADAGGILFDDMRELAALVPIG